MSLPALGLILEGGATASFDSQTGIDKYTVIALSMFKFGGTTTFANSIRSTYPNVKKILGYTTAADVVASGIDCGVTKTQCDSHDAGVGGGTTGDYWLLRSSYPSGTPSGAYSSSAGGSAGVNYFGNIKSSTFQTQWVNNVKSYCSAAGIDGVFIDNTTTVLFGSTAHNPATGVAFTDSTWHDAMVAFIQAVSPQLQAVGLYVMTNTNDGSGTASGESSLFSAIGGSVDALHTEYWMQGSSGVTTPRASGTGYTGWLGIADTPQNLSPAKDFFPNVTNASTDTRMREFTWASYLLKWDGTDYGACLLNSPDGSDMATWTAAQANPGTPAHTMEEINADGSSASANTTFLFRRYFTNGIILVNAHATSSYTVTAFGDGRTYKDGSGTVVTSPTLSAGTALVLHSDTAYSGGGGGPVSWTTVGSGAGTYPGTATSIAFALSAAVQNGDIIVVPFTYSDSTDTFASTTCADSLGNTYTLLGHAFSTPDTDGFGWFYSVVSHPGTPTITVTFPASKSFCNACGAAYRGGSASPLDVVANATGQQSAAGGTDSVIEGPITPTVNGDLIVSAMCNVGNGDAITAGTGYTDDATATVAGGNVLLLESKVQTTAASISPTGTIAAGSHHYVGGAAAFKAGVAASTSYGPLLLGVG